MEHDERRQRKVRLLPNQLSMKDTDDLLPMKVSNDEIRRKTGVETVSEQV